MEGYEIEITEPSGEFPLIDLGRDIEVKGRIKGKIDRDLSLKVELFDREGRLLRYACQNRLKDTSIDLNYPGLVTYKEELDPKKEKLKAFGFPELQVKGVFRLCLFLQQSLHLIHSLSGGIHTIDGDAVDKTVTVLLRTVHISASKPCCRNGTGQESRLRFLTHVNSPFCTECRNISLNYTNL